ncbi:MAG: hypothetical protein ACR2GU_15480 [Rubrobacteraceae bacterium]
MKTNSSHASPVVKTCAVGRSIQAALAEKGPQTVRRYPASGPGARIATQSG